MAVNQVTLANGEELINLTNDTVSEVSLLSGATAHDASGTQIMGKAQFINPNLIINSNFKINQRGKTEYVNEAFGQYTVDMWRSVEWYSTTTVTDTGIVMTGATETATLHFQQLMPYLSLQYGQAYTLSWNNNGIVYTATNIINSTSDRLEYWDGGYHMLLYYAADIQMWVLSLIRDANNPLPFAPHWVKLEPGLVATPYVDPDEALELVKCQRYYREIVGSFPIIGYNNDLLFSTVGSIENMRITPTCYFKTDIFNSNAGVRLTTPDGSYRDGFSFSISTSDKEGTVGIVATKAQHGLDASQGYLVVDKDNPVCLSAEP